MKKVKLYLKIYGAALTAFLLIDMVWIGLFANSFYRNRLGHLLAEDPNLAAGTIFYFLFIAGLIYFAVRPGLEHNKKSHCIFNAVLYGLVTYGTYDLANLALVKDWPIAVTIVDMIWGVAVSVTVAAISMVFGQKLSS